MNRWILRGALCAVFLATAPTVAYEVLQKTAEWVGPRNEWQRLSCAAERDTRWAPSTGLDLVDHTVHEILETRLFWELATRSTSIRRPG